MTVYTSPANAGPGAATEDTGFAGFTGPPEVLPAELTVNAVGGIDAAGANLSCFLEYLATRFGHREFDLVAHSMGVLFSRAAMRQLGESASSLRIRSLTTVGTPWCGGFAADHAAGDMELHEANGEHLWEQVMTAFADETRSLPPGNAGQQVAGRFLNGPDGWNARQAGVLDELTVTLIAGDAFTGNGRMWPHDGLVTTASALAAEVPVEVLPHRRTHVFPDAHSIFFCDLAGLPWERSITWDPDVAAVVVDAITNPVTPDGAA